MHPEVGRARADLPDAASTPTSRTCCSSTPPSRAARATTSCSCCPSSAAQLADVGSSPAVRWRDLRRRRPRGRCRRGRGPAGAPTDESGGRRPSTRHDGPTGGPRSDDGPHEQDRPRPAHRDAAGVRARAGQLAARLGRQLHALVRGDVLGLPGDPLGAGHRPHRRHLPRRHGLDRRVVRQPRRPPPQAAGDAVVGRRVVRAVRRSASGCTSRRPAATFRDPASPLLWTLRRAAHARRHRRRPARHRPADDGDAARPGTAARPGERAGRDDVRRVVPRHLGHQRAARRLRRHAVGAACWPWSCWPPASCTCRGCEVPETDAGPHPQGRRGARGRPARHGAARARRARAWCRSSRSAASTTSSAARSWR